MDTAILHSIHDIESSAWAPLAPAGFPFASHSFLSALESSGSVGADSGWQPRYIIAREHGHLVGASYLFVKSNSYGEYIFDWAWADAYHRHGIPYFPKLTAAVPFTPATGPKLLFHKDADTAARTKIAARLIAEAKGLMAAHDMSSLHYLFITSEDIPFLQAEGLMIRHSFQYHWKNNGYGNFDDFLSSLRSKKARQIRRERAELQSEPLSIRLLTGVDLTPEHADIFFPFYLATIDKNQAIPYLTRGFFRAVFATMRDQIVLILAEDQGQPIAGSLFYRQGTQLYGRYWGALKEVRNLHFELCYYRAIEWAIEQKITLFEAGAQGQHKVARGFLPALTYSAHWIAHPAFRNAIGAFIDQERREIATLFAAMDAQSPYQLDKSGPKQGPAPDAQP